MKLRAKITQSGTTAPTVQDAVNGFVSDLTYSRQALGSYRITSAGGNFTGGKTIVMIPSITVSDDTGKLVYVVWDHSEHEVNIQTWADLERTTPVEWNCNGIPIKIDVYP